MESPRYILEKRDNKRKNFFQDIYYPCINNQSVHKNYSDKYPIISLLDISESGMRLSSLAPVNVGDFISFLIKVGDNPSFWCLCQVKWVNCIGNNYLAGCQFFILTKDQRGYIREYIEKN